MGLERQQAKKKLDEAKKKQEEIASEWKKTADSILLQASNESIKTKEDSISSQHSLVEKLRRQIGAQEIATQVLQWQLTSAQEKKQVEQKEWQADLSNVRQKVVAMRHQLNTLKLQVEHLIEALFHEVESSFEKVVLAIPEPKVGPKESAEIASVAVSIRSALLNLIKQVWVLSEKGEVGMRHKMHSSKELQAFLTLLVPSGDIESVWDVQYVGAVAIINAIPALMLLIEQGINAIKVQLETSSRLLGHAKNEQALALKKMQQAEADCAVAKVRAKEAIEEKTKAEEKRQDQRFVASRLSDKDEAKGEQKIIVNKVEGHVEEIKKVAIEQPEVPKVEKDKLKPLAGPRRCYCHRCGQGPYTRAVSICGNCSHSLMFPVTACLPMAPEERAIYFKRAQNWLARHRLVRAAKTPLTVDVKSITETESSLAKSSVRLSPPPYVKLDRLYIASSPQSPEPVKITSRLAPLIL